MTTVEPPAFAAHLERHGASPALIAEDGTRLSYAELAARADAFAARLGATRRLIAIEAANDFDAIIAYMGSLRGGHAVLLLPANAERLIDTYRPDAIYRDGKLELSAPEGGLHPELALMLSTSGTTGAVKLVRLSRGALDANAASIVEYLGITKDERAITSLPIHYSYGLSVLHSHLAAGAALLVTEMSVIDPRFWDFFERESGTSLAGVPHSYELIERAGVLESRALPTLRMLTQAGGRMPPERVSRLGNWALARGVGLFVMYGQTEATARIAYLPPELLGSHPDCIGVAVPGGTLSIDAGELVYRGPNVMMGYALDRADLARGAELEELRTGDIGERTDDGLFRILGRKARFVKPFGLRVSLDEIEAWLASRGIEAMVAGSDELIAVASSTALDAGQLARRFALPEALFDVARVDAFPMLPSGKRDYRAVLNAAEARRAEAPDEGIAGAFAAVFGPQAVSSDASFNRLEGDSLSYVSIATEIDRRVGYLPERWEAMTIAELDALCATPAHPGHRWLKPFDSEIVLRAMAIMGVVLAHSGVRLAEGGSDVLMILAGYSLARFNFARLTDSGGWHQVRNLLVRVILPYYLLMIAYAALRGDPGGWPAWALVSNFAGRFSGLLVPFWFIEALLHATIVIALLFSLKSVRRFAAAEPVRFAILLFGAALAVRAGAYQIFHHDHLRLFSTDAVFPLFAFGWLLFFARTRTLRIVCVVIALFLALANASVLGSEHLWGGRSLPVGLRRVWWVTLTPVLLLFLPRIPLPSLVGRLFALIAAVSFTIYLTHMLPAHVLTRHFDLGPLVSLAATILFAWVLVRALEWGRAQMRSRLAFLWNRRHRRGP